MGERSTRHQKEVRKDLEALLQSDLGDTELRLKLEKLSLEYAFPGLTPLWGPAIYRRNHRFFRPLIASKFSNYAFIKKWKWKPIPWSAELSKWMEETDRDDEVELFRQLYAWSLSSKGYKKARLQWLKDLSRRFKQARSRKEQQLELEKMNQWWELDEQTALEIYTRLPQGSTRFILSHLPSQYTWYGGLKRELWSDLAARARQEGDDELYYSLYCRQVPLEKWRQDALALAKKLEDSAELVEALNRHHPEGWGLDLGPVFLELVQARGVDVFGYLIPHLRNVRRGWFKNSYQKLSDLAQEKGWWDFWSGLVRVVATHKEFNREIARLVDQGREDRLLLLTGVSREWNFRGWAFGRFQALDEGTALKLYQRYPELVRGPYLGHLSVGWDRDYSRLLEAALAENDEALVDFMASRLVNRVGHYDSEKKMLAGAERLAAVYKALLEDPPEFARRAAAVLGQVPPYTIYCYHRLVRNNRLARLLYEQTAEIYLADEGAFQDLIEAPEIHAQKTAYRALTTGSSAATRLGKQNLTLLLGTLLRPLHRKTRLVAFQALEAICDDQQTAVRVLEGARQALDLPERGYPKEELVGLIGQLLNRWPELCSKREQRVVYGR